MYQGFFENYQYALSLSYSRGVPTHSASVTASSIWEETRRRGVSKGQQENDNSVGDKQEASLREMIAEGRKEM